MFAQALQSKLSKLGIYYGWVMVGIVFITSFCSAAVSSVPQIIIVPMTQEFGWNISDVSVATALMYLILAMLCPFGPALILKIGMKNVVLISVVLEILGLFFTVVSYEKWHLLFSIGVCLGVASGIIGLGLSSTVAVRWFNFKRGLVLGIMGSAFAAGSLLFLPLMAWITTSYNWKFAIVPGLVGMCICGLLFLFFGKEWPAELNLPPLGEKKIYQPPPKDKESFISISFCSLSVALKHPAFWLISFTFFICGFTSTGLVGQHFIPFCGDNNVGIILASSFLAIMGVCNMIGTIGSGWLSDRFNNYKLLGIYYALRGFSLIYLPFSDFGVFALTLWAVFFGLDFIATVPPTVRLISKQFGIFKGPVIFGWVFAAHQSGSAAATYGAGLTRDVLQTYAPAFLFAGAACFLATALIILYQRFTPNLIIESG